MGSYTYPKFTYKSVADLLTQTPQHKPLVIVGAGPVGLAAAIDARFKGLDVLLLDEDDSVSFGSRAVAANCSMSSWSAVRTSMRGGVRAEHFCIR